jgi:hypothetical protein
LQQRRRTLLELLLMENIQATELPNGYRYVFTARPHTLVNLAQLVALEHQCCRFLTFALTVYAGEETVAIEVNGPKRSQIFDLRNL